MPGSRGLIVRILHCIRSLDPAGGGPADFVRMVAEFQSSFGIEIEVVTQDEPNCRWIESFPATVHALGPVKDTFGYSKRLDRWLRENLSRFDVTVINGVWCYMSYAASQVCLKARHPYVLFTHGMLDPWFSQKYPFKHLKKCAYWGLFEHKVLSHAQAVFFTCEQERVRSAQAFRPYLAREVVIGYGTVDPQDRLVTATRQWAQNNPELFESRYLLYLGRMHEKKGIDLLINAFERTCATIDINLVLAGPPAPGYKHVLHDVLDKLHPSIRSRVQQFEMVSGETKWGLLANAQGLVLPSHQENFARVVSEALSCGTPVLVSNKVNIHPVIEQWNAGLVDQDDESGVVRLLTRWLRLTETEVKQMRTQARLCYESSFDARKNFVEYIGKLQDVAGQTKPV